MTEIYLNDLQHQMKPDHVFFWCVRGCNLSSCQTDSMSSKARPLMGVEYPTHCSSADLLPSRAPTRSCFCWPAMQQPQLPRTRSVRGAPPSSGSTGSNTLPAVLPPGSTSFHTLFTSVLTYSLSFFILPSSTCTGSQRSNLPRSAPHVELRAPHTRYSCAPFPLKQIRICRGAGGLPGQASCSRQNRDPRKIYLMFQVISNVQTLI